MNIITRVTKNNYTLYYIVIIYLAHTKSGQSWRAIILQIARLAMMNKKKFFILTFCA